MYATALIFAFFFEVFSSEYLAATVFVIETDKMFDSFMSEKCAAAGPRHIWGQRVGSFSRMVNLPSRSRLHHRMGGSLISVLSAMCGEH